MKVDPCNVDMMSPSAGILRRLSARLSDGVRP